MEIEKRLLLELVREASYSRLEDLKSNLAKANDRLERIRKGKPVRLSEERYEEIKKNVEDKIIQQEKFLKEFQYVVDFGDEELICEGVKIQ